MNTVRRLIYGEVFWAIVFVTVGFLSLFLFFDLVDDLSQIGRVSFIDPERQYGLTQSLTYVLLLSPSRLYELLPITVLIGSVYGLVRMAQNSEFTILRTSGLGPIQALRHLLVLGLFFSLLTNLIGDHVAPLADRTGQLLKAEFRGQISTGQTGAWLKERADQQQFSVNIRSMDANGELVGIKIFEFNPAGRIQRTIDAKKAVVEPGYWRLEQATINQFTKNPEGTDQLSSTFEEEVEWQNSITSEMIAMNLLRPDRMKTLDLYQYIQHLESNQQASLRYEIEFWRKVFYPLSCLVMVVLALPFAYLHFRSKGSAGYVFAGVMIGISFFLMNHVFSHMGNLRAWEPWLAAASPGLLYSMLSLGAFGWLVLKR